MINHSIFNFLSSPAIFSDTDMTCLVDQADSTAATIAGLDLSDSISTAPSTTTNNNNNALTSYPPPSTAPTDFSLPPAHTGTKHDGPTTHPPSHQRDDGPPRKRARIDDSPEYTSESLEYWLRFNKEEAANQQQQNDDLHDCEASERPTGVCPQRRPCNPTQTSAASGVPSLFSAADPFCDAADPVDETVWDHAFSDENDTFSAVDLAQEMSSLDSAPPPTQMPPREGLYSTPLSWERPQVGPGPAGFGWDRPQAGLGLRPESGWERPQLGPRPGPGFPIGPTTTLSDAERCRLLDIAMNTTTSRPTSSFDFEFSPECSPWASVAAMGGPGRHGRITESPVQPPLTSSSSRRNSSKTQSDVDASSPERASPPLPPQPQPHPATAPPHTPARAKQPQSAEKGKEKPKLHDRSGHNDIERKYRTNLKDRIAELRDAVPSLRSMGDDGADDDDYKAAKVSKGTILMKATEYIRYLERKNRAIKQERQELEVRLHAAEQLMAAAAKQTFLMQHQAMAAAAPFNPPGFA